MEYKNIIKYTVFSSLLFLSLNGEANALVGVDLGEAVGQVGKTVSKVVEDAEQKVQPVVRKYKSIKTGLKSAIESSEMIKKGKEMYEKAQELKDKAEETMDTFNETKDSAMNAYSEAKGTYDEAKGKYDEAKAMGEDAADQAKAAKEQAQLSTDLKGLKEDLEKVKKEYAEYISVETSKINAQIQSLTQNNSMLQKMAEQEDGDTESAALQLTQNNQKIKALQEQLAGLEQSKGAKELQERQAEIEAKIAEKEQQIAEMATTLATYGLAAAGMVAGAVQACLDSKGMAWNTFKVDNFLQAGEAMGGKAFDRLKNKYIEVAKKDTIDAYLTALEVKNNIEATRQKQKELTDGVIKTESSGAAVSIESSGVRVANIRMLFDNIKLQIAEMKMETANDMMNLPVEDIVGYTPPEIFTFDDYIFNPNESEGGLFGGGGLLGGGLSSNPKELFDQGKNMVEQGKEKVGEAKEKVGEAKETVGAVKDTADAFKDAGSAASAITGMATGNN